MLMLSPNRRVNTMHCRQEERERERDVRHSQKITYVQVKKNLSPIDRADDSQWPSHHETAQYPFRCGKTALTEN